jgi:uracil phosphoribosyltransferase
VAFKNLIQLSSPLVTHYLTLIRDKRTSFSDFRKYVNKLAVLLASEASIELAVRRKKIETPLASFTGSEAYEEVVLVPVLRAGLGLVDGFTELFPDAKVGHIGVYRDEKTLKPVKYYFKFPRVKAGRNVIVFILDPMLATGGSIIHSVSELRKHGVKKIVVISLVSAPEGIKAVRKHYKALKIYTCSLDKRLNGKGYIVPGLGDAGDRMFGT